MGENQNQKQRSWSRLGVVRNAAFADGREIVEVRGDDHIVRSMGRKDRHSKVCTATAAFVSPLTSQFNSTTYSRNNHNGFEMVLTLTLRWMNLTDTSPRCKHYRRRCKIRDCHNEAKNALEIDPLYRHNVPRHEVEKASVLVTREELPFMLVTREELPFMLVTREELPFKQLKS
nr:E3 ubiquitin-protein ligase MIEL1 [Ipomoea batatas]